MTLATTPSHSILLQLQLHSGAADAAEQAQNQSSEGEAEFDCYPAVSSCSKATLSRVMEDNRRRISTATAIEDHADLDWDYIRLRSSQTSSTLLINNNSPANTPRLNPFARFWRNHIRISVPHADCRDHLANERTFLGYLRSSVALSIIGVLIAQLYRLQHAPNPDPVFGYYVLGKPVAAIMQASALIVLLVGTHRFWRQQSAMVRGKIHAAGWEILFVSGYCLLLLVGLFAIHVGVDVYKATRECSGPGSPGGGSNFQSKPSPRFGLAMHEL